MSDETISVEPTEATPVAERESQPTKQPQEEPTEADLQSDQDEPEFDVESEAKKAGWDPDFKPKKPTQRKLTPEEFLEYKERRADQKKMESLVLKQQRQIEALLRAQEDTQKSARQIEIEQRRKELAIIEARQRQAVRDGDEHAYDALIKQREAIIAAPYAVKDTRVQIPDEQPAPSDVSQYDSNPLMSEFVKANAWYANDAELRDFADHLGAKIAQEGYSGKALLNEVARRVKTMMPQRVAGQPKKAPQPMVEAREATSSAARVRLGGEEKRMHDSYVENMVKAGVFKDKAAASKDWLNTYSKLK